MINLRFCLAARTNCIILTNQSEVFNSAVAVIFIRSIKESQRDYLIRRSEDVRTVLLSVLMSVMGFTQNTVGVFLKFHHDFTEVFDISFVKTIINTDEV